MTERYFWEHTWYSIRLAASMWERYAPWPVARQQIKPILSAWTLGIGTQAYSTSLIAWEVWKRGVTTTASSRSQSSYYKAIISMIIESGALYTSLVLPLAITFGLGATTASLVIAGLLNPMSGLIPASMVIRVCMNRNRKFQTTFLSQVREDQSVDGRNDSGGSSEAGIGITFSKFHHPEKAEVDI
ncbi:hypothetical protein D9756_009953 [Leucocoprinus leucothites]|uniref:Uncharacterized protein n=1 Tax=Leucocoprinus leucothites TaxID=201217 RepID=A0A8H5FSR7_9AGAR|nr:hypothetical protein D9756_009953 [Leucoagaricus leucothites]